MQGQIQNCHEHINSQIYTRSATKRKVKLTQEQATRARKGIYIYIYMYGSTLSLT